MSQLDGTSGWTVTPDGSHASILPRKDAFWEFLSLSPTMKSQHGATCPDCDSNKRSALCMNDSFVRTS